MNIKFHLHNLRFPLQMSILPFLRVQLINSFLNNFNLLIQLSLSFKLSKYQKSL